MSGRIGFSGALALALSLGASAPGQEKVSSALPLRSVTGTVSLPAEGYLLAVNEAKATAWRTRAAGGVRPGGRRGWSR